MLKYSIFSLSLPNPNPSALSRFWCENPKSLTPPLFRSHAASLSILRRLPRLTLPPFPSSSFSVPLRLMGENFPVSSCGSSASLFADSNGWINPRRHRNPGDGVGGGNVDSTPPTPPPPVRFYRKRRPDPTTSTDPYWIRGGFQPQTPDDLSDDEADLSYLGDGLLGGAEEEHSSAQIEPVVVMRKRRVIDFRSRDNIRCPPTAVTIPPSGGPAGAVEDSTEYEFLISTNDQWKWDEAVAEAEEFVKKMFPESDQ